MFSIIIPTLNNLNYLKLCIKSIKNNSSFNHQIIHHVNLGEDGTKEFLKGKSIAILGIPCPEKSKYMHEYLKKFLTKDFHKKIYRSKRNASTIITLSKAG